MGLLIWEHSFITVLFHGVRCFASFCLSFSYMLDGGMALGYIVCSERECCHASSQWFALCSSRLWKWEMCLTDFGEERWMWHQYCVMQYRVLRKVCGRTELQFSQNLKVMCQYFSMFYYNQHYRQGFRILSDASPALRQNDTPSDNTWRLYMAHMLCSMSFVREYTCSTPYSSEEDKSNKTQILDCWLALNYLPDIPTVCKVSKSSPSKSARNIAQHLPPCKIGTPGHNRGTEIRYLYRTPVHMWLIHLHAIAPHITSDILFLSPSMGESQVSPGCFHHCLAGWLAGWLTGWLQSPLSPGLKLPIKAVSYRSPPTGVGDLSCTLWFLALRDGERDK